MSSSGMRNTTLFRAKSRRSKPKPITEMITTTCGRIFGSSSSRFGRVKPVVQDAVFGHHAALGCHLANESYFQKEPCGLG
jgi:hypothetical protein